MNAKTIVSQLAPTHLPSGVSRTEMDAQIRDLARRTQLRLQEAAMPAPDTSSWVRRSCRSLGDLLFRRRVFDQGNVMNAQTIALLLAPSRLPPGVSRAELTAQIQELARRTKLRLQEAAIPAPESTHNKSWLRSGNRGSL